MIGSSFWDRRGCVISFVFLSYHPMLIPQASEIPVILNDVMIHLVFYTMSGICLSYKT